jgi:uncharacterized protein YigA (DUF484 family)
MSQDPQETNQQQLLDFLRSHPETLAELIKEQPGILDAMSRPELQGDESVVDFQQQRINQLNQALDQHTGIRDELIDTSRSNMQTQQQVHEAVLDIVARRDLESLMGYISRDMSHTLRLDAVILCVESQGQHYPFIREPIMSVDAGSIANVFRDGRNIILGEPDELSRHFFGPAASLVQSQALIRLTVEDAPTSIMLAIGDRDPDYFHKGQATHLLRFLGDALATRLSQFMGDARSSGTEPWSSPETPQV